MIFCTFCMPPSGGLEIEFASRGLRTLSKAETRGRRNTRNDLLQLLHSRIGHGSAKAIFRGAVGGYAKAAKDIDAKSDNQTRGDRMTNTRKEAIMTITGSAFALQRIGVRVSRDAINDEPVAGLFLLRPGEAEPAQPNLILTAGDVRRLLDLLEGTLKELGHEQTAVRTQ